MRPHPRPAVILLVDDDPEDAFLMRRAFSKGKLLNDFHHVSSGEAMFAFLRHEGHYDPSQRPLLPSPPPDLILLDINMPGMGGLAALETLRADPDLRRIPVVVLSTSDDVTDVLKSYDIGANSYVTKPVDVAGMMKVANLFDQYWFQLVRLPASTE